MPNGRRAFGMPDLGSGSINEILSAVHGTANSLKDDDLFRQKELLRFKKSLENEQTAAQQMELARGAVNRGPGATNPMKHETVYAPPTAMQQKFRAEEIANQANKFALGRLGAQNEGRLNTALATGKLRNEGLGLTANAAAARAEADRASREDIAKGNREAANARSDAQLKNARDIASTGRTEPFTVKDPVTGEDVTVWGNKRTNELERATLGGEPVGPLTKPGTPGKVQGMTPEQFEDIQSGTDEALKAIDLLLDPATNKLTSEAAYASGWSNLGRIPEYLPFAHAQQTGGTRFDSLKSKLVIDLIQRMKAASKTGATGFGALNLKELGTLENSALRAAAGKNDAENELALQEAKALLQKVKQRQQEKAAPAPRQPGTKPGVSKLQDYGGYGTTPAETASSIYQPGQAHLPITGPAAPPQGQTLRPDAAEFLRRAGAR